MKTSLTTAAIFVWMCCATVTSASGALLLEDNMNYGPAPITGTDDFGPWVVNSAATNYDTANLSFVRGSYLPLGNDGATGSFVKSDTSYDRAAHRAFTEGAETGTFWMSALMNVSETSTSRILGISLHTNDDLNALRFHGDAFGLAGKDGALRPALFEQDAAGSRIKASITENEYDTTTALSTGITYLLIAKVTVGAGADSLDFWVKSESDGFGVTEASLGAPNFSRTDRDFGSFLKYVGAGGDVNTVGSIDAFRISSGNGDAGLSAVLIPEPGTFALLALAGLLLTTNGGRRKV